MLPITYFAEQHLDTEQWQGKAIVAYGEGSKTILHHIESALIFQTRTEAEQSALTEAKRWIAWPTG
jgi:hypothetical protein